MDVKLKAQRAQDAGFVPGAKFGIYTVEKVAPSFKLGVRCDCGKRHTVQAKMLRRWVRLSRRACSRNCGLKGWAKALHARQSGFMPGAKFGVLTVIEAPSIDAVKVLCGVCGGVRAVNGYWLKTNPTSCCNDCQTALRRLRKVAQWAGRRFGRLTVESLVGTRRWLCRCDCGNTLEVDRSNLQTGRTRSCGCLWQDYYKDGRPAGGIQCPSS